MQIFPVKHIKKRGESLVVMVIVNQFIKNVCLYEFDYSYNVLKIYVE
jgi:hypothetical protein